MMTMRFAFAAILVGCAGGSATAQTAQIPDAIAAKGETVVLTVHAEGAQVYDCKVGEAGRLAWQFREPVSTLSRTARPSAGIMWARPGSMPTAAASSAKRSAAPTARPRRTFPGSSSK